MSRKSQGGAARAIPGHFLKPVRTRRAARTGEQGRRVVRVVVQADDDVRYGNSPEDCVLSPLQVENRRANGVAMVERRQSKGPRRCPDCGTGVKGHKSGTRCRPCYRRVIAERFGR